MKSLKHLLDQNRSWSRGVRRADPSFFRKLSRQQSPRYLWIGCSDSRVPANQIIGLMPGEIFVHRNVANLVVHTDLNCLSVLQFAVDVLGVEHVIVCGHYGCGGVRAVLKGAKMGLIDNWLRHIEDVREKHERALARLAPAKRLERLCELNVVEQVYNVCNTSIVQNAWKRRKPLTVHGWVYGLTDGLIRDLRFNAARPGDVERLYRSALR